MRVVFTIVKRGLVSYFSSPVAYVFLVIFLLLTGFFTFTAGNFFERGEASLAAFFGWHPWLYLVLVPAVGMRLWAEERRSGTLELLLTMPVAPWQAIVAKFLASWIFIGVALALTFPAVITVNVLGDPDNGMIVAGYLGSFFLAGAYLAITCMTSAMTRNQVVAFILSVVLCLFLILAGFNPVTDLLARWANPARVDTVAAFSVVTHFDGFQRGVIDLRDLVFFLSVIGFALFATGLIIRGHRAGGHDTEEIRATDLFRARPPRAAPPPRRRELPGLARPGARRPHRRRPLHAFPGHEKDPARAAIAGEDQALRVAGRRRAGAAARLRAARGRHAARVQAGGGLQPDRGALQPEARLGGRGRGAARRHRAAAALHRRAVLPRRRGEPARSQAGDPGGFAAARAPARVRPHPRHRARGQSRAAQDRPHGGAAGARREVQPVHAPELRALGARDRAQARVRREGSADRREGDRQGHQRPAAHPSARRAAANRIRPRSVRAARRQAHRLCRPLRVLRSEPDHARRSAGALELHSADAVQGLGPDDGSGQGGERRRVRLRRGTALHAHGALAQPHRVQPRRHRHRPDRDPALCLRRRFRGQAAGRHQGHRARQELAEFHAGG